MHIVLSDLEGVFTPEIWINVAEKTGIEALRLTTRDVPDYDVLMQGRLKLLEEHNLTIGDIQEVISRMDPLPGAVEFLDELREKTQIIIVSDTFSQFAGPLMKKLGYPTLFCHSLVIEPDGRISGYTLRQKDGKRHVALALKGLYYRVIALGDSYNDTAMLKEADKGILFRPPANVVNEFPEFPVAREYDELRTLLDAEL